jgi:hypothetical protein
MGPEGRQAVQEVVVCIRFIHERNGLRHQSPSVVHGEHLLTLLLALALASLLNCHATIPGVAGLQNLRDEILAHRAKAVSVRRECHEQAVDARVALE